MMTAASLQVFGQVLVRAKVANKTSSVMLHRSAKSALNDGFTIVEAIIAITLFLIFFASVGPIIVRPQLVGKRASTYDAIEASISRDLGWIKAYSKSWKCLNGRYQGCANITSALSYNPTPAECVNIVNSFLASASAATTVPPRPNPVPVAASTTTSAPQQIVLPASVSGTTLQRTLAADSTAKQIVVTYTSAGNVEQQKQSSVYIEAAAWCQP